MGFQPKVLLPGETMEVPITFYPREVMQYKEKVFFEINDSAKHVVEILGQGIELKVRRRNSNLRSYANFRRFMEIPFACGFTVLRSSHMAILSDSCGRPQRPGGKPRDPPDWSEDQDSDSCGEQQPSSCDIFLASEPICANAARLQGRGGPSPLTGIIRKELVLKTVFLSQC